MISCPCQFKTQIVIMSVMLLNMAGGDTKDTSAIFGP